MGHREKGISKMQHYYQVAVRKHQACKPSQSLLTHKPTSHQPQKWKPKSYLAASVASLSSSSSLHEQKLSMEKRKKQTNKQTDKSKQSMSEAEPNRSGVYWLFFSFSITVFRHSEKHWAKPGAIPSCWAVMYVNFENPLVKVIQMLQGVEQHAG